MPRSGKVSSLKLYSFAQLCEDAGVEPDEARALFKQITEAVLTGRQVMIPRFGRFYGRPREERVQRVPVSPGSRRIRNRVVPAGLEFRFRPLQSLRDHVRRRLMGRGRGTG